MQIIDMRQPKKDQTNQQQNKQLMDMARTEANAWA